MSFEISVAQESQHTLVTIRGQASLGQLFSLLQVLQIDCRFWPHEDVLFDLRGLDDRFTPDQRARVRAEAVRCLPRIKSIEMLWG